MFLSDLVDVVESDLCRGGSASSGLVVVRCVFVSLFDRVDEVEWVLCRGCASEGLAVAVGVCAVSSSSFSMYTIL